MPYTFGIIIDEMMSARSTEIIKYHKEEKKANVVDQHG